jgi:hypothetical protein
MKKVLFLMILPFLLLGTASVSAQVRIGGSGTPHSAAVLDLNADNETTPTGSQGGLALPRVELATVTMQLNNTDPINGMLVYNTGGTLATGVYVWMTNQWVKASNGSVAYEESESIKLDGARIKRSALTGDVTAAENSNETTIEDDAVTSAKILDKTITAADIAVGAVGSLQLADGAIVNSKLADASVTPRTLHAMGATDGQILAFNDGSWAPTAPSGSLGVAGGGRFVVLTRAASTAFAFSDTNYYIPVGCRPGTSTAGLLTPVAGSNYVGTWDYSGSDIMLAVFSVQTMYAVCDRNAACTCIFQTF